MTLAACLALLLATSAIAARPRLPLLAGETAYHASWANPVNRALYRLMVCETGGINGGRPLWTHSNSTYAGALGFTHATWRQFRVYVRPLPPEHAYQARPGEQYAVGRKLVQLYGYSPWPTCSIRLGLR